MPSCFYDVTRQEAERMLENNPECGDIILRPSTFPNNYALTLRQVNASGPVMKNYRVTCTTSGFVIELDSAVTVSSLDEVLNYFLEKTEHRLKPYMKTQPYDTCIELPPAPMSMKSSSTPKTVPKAQVAPMMRSQADKDSSPSLQPGTKTSESDYVVPYDHDTKQTGQ
ncbi:hypothetical protein LDENG_00027070 [Lucifuga dentata]|nr:hypothetical protein LDENG_00027070 [Lucifuga dentata]